MKIIIFLVAILFSFQVKSQQVGYKIRCNANHIAGDSVKEAIDNCVEYTHLSRDLCAKKVNCTTYLTHCTAKGWAGDNVKLTIENCHNLGRLAKAYCARYMSCK